MKKVIISLLVGIGLLVSVDTVKAWSTEADLEIVYVSTNGANIYPFDSLENACTNFQSLSTLRCKEIVVDSGTYYFEECYRNESGFMFPDVIRSLNGADTTIIDLGGKIRIGFHGLSNYGLSSYCQIDGFTFQNGGLPYRPAVNAYGAIIQNCIFRDCGKEKHGEYWWIQNYAFYLDYSLLYNCLLYDIGGSSAIINSYMINCTILGTNELNKNTTIYMAGRSSENSIYSDPAIYNSIIMMCNVEGMPSWYDNIPLICYNTIVSNYINVTLDNCIITNDAGVILTTNSATVGFNSAVNNNIVEVSLRSDSCAIDYGRNLSVNENSTDLYGGERIVNEIVDSGCVEFGASEKIQTVVTKGSAKKKILVMWKKDRKGRNVRWEIYRGTVNDLSSAQLVSQINDKSRNHFEDRDSHIKPGETYYYWIKKIILDTSMKSSEEISIPDSGYIQASSGLYPLVRCDKATYSVGDIISVDISLFPNEYVDQSKDFWIVANTGNDWYQLNSNLQWVQFNGHPTLQANLFELEYYRIFEWSLPAGNYTFYFGMDAPDGVLNSSITYDSQNVEVQ